MTLAEYLKPEVFKRGLAEGIEKGLEKGLEKGVQKGLEKGREEGRVEIIKAMLLKGVVGLDTIAEATGHSKEEIKKLLS